MRYPTATLKKSSSLTKTSTKPSSVSSATPSDTSIQPGQLTQEQFERGCSRYGLDSESSLRNFLPTLDTGFLDKKEFRDFYKFCFQFHRQQKTHRTLDKDLVAALLPLILQDRVPTHRTQSFGEFLLSSKDPAYDKITLDQWMSFLDFCNEFDHVSTFDPDGSAWPTLIDDYVAFCLTKGHQ
jgi:hypothetical protein